MYLSNVQHRLSGPTPTTQNHAKSLLKKRSNLLILLIWSPHFCEKVFHLTHCFIKIVIQPADAPYQVTFTKQGNNLNAFCTCPAGMHGQYCKHRFAIMSGDSAGIVSDNGDEVERVRDWIAGSDVEDALCELAEAEHEFDAAKERLAVAKRKLAASMRK